MYLKLTEEALVKNSNLFSTNVLRIVNDIPKGMVMSYGQIALVCGNPRAARQVGWVLSGLGRNRIIEDGIPWWRVVNKDGVITIVDTGIIEPSSYEQKRLLISDGVPFLGDFTVDIKRCRYIPDYTL